MKDFDWTPYVDILLGRVEHLSDADAAEVLDISESSVNRFRRLREAGESVNIDRRGRPQAALLRVIEQVKGGIVDIQPDNLAAASGVSSPAVNVEARGGAADGDLHEAEVRSSRSDMSRQIDDILRGPGTEEEKDRRIEKVAAAYRAEALRDEATAAVERNRTGRLEAEKAPSRDAPPISPEEVAALQKAAEEMKGLAPLIREAVEAMKNGTRGQTG